MQILASILISAVMVAGSLFYQKENTPPALGASQTISSLTAGTSLDDADILPYTETLSLTTKKISWANATSTLKTFYDTLYSPIFSTSAGFFALVSDETGSAGGVVRATSPTLTTPTINSPTIDSPTINTSFAGTAVLGILQGGTGSTTKNAALNALLPLQTGNSGRYLQTNATDVSWSQFSFPSSLGASSTVLTEDGNGNLRWYGKESCKVYIDVGNLSNSIGRTYVNINHDFRSTSTIVRADWALSESVGTASSNWGHGVGTTTATSSNFTVTTNITAAGSGSGGGNASYVYLIYALLDDKPKLFAWVNYMSATNTQIAWDIRATDTVNHSITIEVCP